MLKLYVFRFFLLAVTFIITHNAQALAAPSVQAESAILINAQTGGVIFEKNADIRRSPASLTKIMTCILGLEEKGLDAMFSVSMAAAATEYSDLGMKGGDKMRSGELMRGMMLESDNGAAVVVAQNVSGSVLKFADRMNAKAKELGCRKTHFSNPHGLTARWHYTTARDMSKIAAYAMKNPNFRSIVGAKSSVIRWISPASKTYKADNTNRLLGSYSGVSGIKTGWTNAARGCLAASAKRNDVELIAIVLKSPDGQSRFADAQKLLDYGFSVGGKGKIVVEKTGDIASKRMPYVKKPGIASLPAGNKQPASTAIPATKQPVTSLPAKTSSPTVKTPAVSSAPAARGMDKATNAGAAPAVRKNSDTAAANAAAGAGSDTVTVNTNAADTDIVSTKTDVKDAGIRMPVIRRPGA